MLETRLKAILLIRWANLKWHKERSKRSSSAHESTLLKDLLATQAEILMIKIIRSLALEPIQMKEKVSPSLGKSHNHITWIGVFICLSQYKIQVSESLLCSRLKTKRCSDRDLSSSILDTWLKQRSLKVRGEIASLRNLLKIYGRHLKIMMAKMASLASSR